MVSTAIQTFYRRRKVLVTGGAGFIGSNLVAALVKLGSHVTILDNFSTGSVENIQQVVHKIELIVGDIRSPDICHNATANKSVIFHLAALASVSESIKSPQKCHDINTRGTNTLIQSASQQACHACIVFSSSAAIYGNQHGICSENTTPNPQSPYALSKLKGEIACSEYARNTGSPAVALRYFNVYGDQQKKIGETDGVVAQFTAAIKKNKKITIFGKGVQMRDYIHVSKIIEANLVSAVAHKKGFDLFNIASGKSISLLQLVKKLEQELGQKNAGIIFNEARTGDILHSHAECDKFKALTRSIL